MDQGEQKHAFHIQSFFLESIYIFWHPKVILNLAHMVLVGLRERALCDCLYWQEPNKQEAVCCGSEEGSKGEVWLEKKPSSFTFFLPYAGKIVNAFFALCVQQNDTAVHFPSSLQIGGTYARPLVLPPQVCIGAFGKLQVSTETIHWSQNCFLVVNHCIGDLFSAFLLH